MGVGEKLFQLFPTEPLIKTLNQVKGESKENLEPGQEDMADSRDGRHHFPLFLGMTIKVSVLCTLGMFALPSFTSVPAVCNI